MFSCRPFPQDHSHCHNHEFLFDDAFCKCSYNSGHTFPYTTSLEFQSRLKFFARKFDKILKLFKNYLANYSKTRHMYSVLTCQNSPSPSQKNYTRTLLSSAHLCSPIQVRSDQRDYLTQSNKTCRSQASDSIQGLSRQSL